MAKTKSSKKSRTVVTFLLDRSGSMQAIKAATIEGFNGYVRGLQEEKETDISFSFLTFDTGSLDKIYVGEPIANVQPLNDHSYKPRGGTPLIDASVKTIRATEVALNGSKKKTRVVVCIQTDGQENESTEHTWEELRALVTQKQADGWEFLFMGAGIDAYAQGARMGIGARNTMSYEAKDIQATKEAFFASSHNTRAFGSGVAASTAYSDLQKLAAGDKFWHGQAMSGAADLTGKTLIQPPRPVGKRRKTTPDVTL